MTSENCTYKTPCGWCSKWDKECDKKIGYPRDKRAEVGVYDNAIKCDHEWIYEVNHIDGAGRLKCYKCGKIVDYLEGAVFL